MLEEEGRIVDWGILGSSVVVGMIAVVLETYSLSFGGEELHLEELSDFQSRSIPRLEIQSLRGKYCWPGT